MGRWANKYVIGLTGNIAMGKSTVRKMLENLGAYTIDADALVHQATSPGAPAYAPVVETFGKWIVGADKKIDRSRLGAIAFAHPDAMVALEMLTHPIVSQAIDLLISHASQPIVVVEAIKLVDGPLGSQVDTIWVVDSTVEQQVQRLMIRRNLSEADARQRVAAQNPQSDKLTHANLIIHNDGSPESLYAQVQQGWDLAQRALNRTAPPPQGQSTRILDPAPIAVPVAPAVSSPALAQPIEENLPTTHILPPLTPMVTRQVPPEVTTRQLPPQPNPVPAAPITPVAPTQPVPDPQPVVPSPVQAPVTEVTPLSTPEPKIAPPPPRLPQTGRLVLPDSTILVEIRRGRADHTDAIARLLAQATRKPVTSTDVLLAFGERSFFLAESAGRSIGLISFQVENLITRISDVITVPDVPVQPVVNGLLSAVENAARSLQSEVAFISVNASTPPQIVQAFLGNGYERISVDSLRIPAWREAAAEMQLPGSQVLMRRLRESLVLTPN